MRTSFLRIIGLLLGLSLAIFFAVPAQASNIGVTRLDRAPGPVQAGSTILVQGNVLVPPDNHLPPEIANGNSTITLVSNAFPGGSATLNVWGPVSMAPGTFSGEVAIRSDLRSGDYTVTGSFAGASVGTAHFTVIGAAVQPQPTARPGAPASTPPNLPGTGQPAQLPSWWPAALTALLVLVLAPWVGIGLLWRKRS